MKETPIYEREQATPAKPGLHQDATPAVARDDEAPDTLGKNEAGPEHIAPSNEKFSAAFDEFAGVFARDHATFHGRAWACFRAGASGL